MCSAESNLDYKYFIDEKFNGISKLNDSCSNNVSTIGKLIRILKEYFMAQDIYSKAILKSNNNLTQLAKNKTDCFFPILEVFSGSFSSFTNVQKDFSDSLNTIIKSLTLSIENNEENTSRIMSARDSDVISNFKNSQVQLTKARSRYITASSNNDSTSNDDKSDKSVRRLKENYESSIEKYNKMRIHFMDAMRISFDRSKEIQLNHLENMRKMIKNVGNALAKLMTDTKESVDIIKKFYKTYNNEKIFRLWIECNKTVDDISVECFTKAYLDSPNGVASSQLLIDLDNSPKTSPLSSVTMNHETKQKKIVKSRRNAETVSDNVLNIIDQDIPDTTINETNGNNKINFEKNVNALKTTKNKFPPFTFFKRFQSTSDLSNISDNKDAADEEFWQSKSNLNSKVMVDDEGFIIRDQEADAKDRSSRSSSSASSGDNRRKAIKVTIRPMTNSIRKTATKSEVINAAMQLPTPKREKMTDIRRVSNLQRTPRVIKDVDKDRYSRRSMSVFELAYPENNHDQIDNKDLKPTQDNLIIPIASAMTEIISSNDGGGNCVVQGQLVLAWPLYIKEHFEPSQSNGKFESIALEFVSEPHMFSTVQILKQYRDVTKLESVTSNMYNFTMFEEFLQRIITDQSLACKGNRISVPILEYSMELNKMPEKLIECHEQWSKIDGTYAQFYFTLSGKYIEDNKSLTVNMKLLSGGTLEHLSSSSERKPEVHNPQFWSVKLSKSDHSVTVKIKTDGRTPVRLKLGYEFVFENCSLAWPVLRLRPNDKQEEPHFKISLMHYRMISTGNFTQLFEFAMT